MSMPDLGKLLSGAREMQAKLAEVQQRLAERRIEGTAGGGMVQNQPRADLTSAARELADSLDRWDLAQGAADKARRWLEAKEREVSDLEFQVGALRAQLEKLEESYDERRGVAEEELRTHGEETQTLEARLTELGAAFVQPLSSRTDLIDLFARLQSEGTPAAGLRRP